MKRYLIYLAGTENPPQGRLTRWHRVVTAASPEEAVARSGLAPEAIGEESVIHLYELDFRGFFRTQLSAEKVS